MQSNFRVQVSKDYLVFASAHFITFRGHQCETLHGHNYRVGVAVEGAVDAEAFFVLDFSILKQIDPPAGGRDRPQGAAARPRTRSWPSTRRATAPGRLLRPADLRLPRRDCALLPIQNSTAEMLAQYLGTRVRDELQRDGLHAPDAARARGRGELRPVGDLPGDAGRLAAAG